MNLPVFLPLLAYHLQAFHEAEAGGRGRTVSAVLLAAFVAMLFSPFVPFARPPLEPCEVQSPARGGRATGVRSPDCKLADAHQLVPLLDARAPATTPLFVIPDEQMMYFLTGRRSVLEDSEFILYLVRHGFISDADARTQVDEPAAIARFERERPLVVRWNGVGRDRFARALPALAAYIERAYGVVGHAGRFEILAPLL
jgi:hypothetical protein